MSRTSWGAWCAGLAGCLQAIVGKVLDEIGELSDNGGKVSSGPGKNHLHVLHRQHENRSTLVLLKLRFRKGTVRPALVSVRVVSRRTSKPSITRGEPGLNNVAGQFCDITL